MSDLFVSSFKDLYTEIKSDNFIFGFKGYKHCSDKNKISALKQTCIKIILKAQNLTKLINCETTEFYMTSFHHLN